MDEQGADYDAAMAVVKDAYPLPTVESFTNTGMVAHLEKECLSLRRYGAGRRSLQLFSSATRINYVPAYWPLIVFQTFCAAHMHFYSKGILRRKCPDSLEATLYDKFRESLLKQWNDIHPKHQAAWETGEKGEINFVICLCISKVKAYASFTRGFFARIYLGW